MNKPHLLDKGIRAVALSLREFGYPDATDNLVRQHYETWKRGETSADIIFMFAADQFRQAPEIFGEPA